MGERGKVWRKVWAEAKDLGKKLIFPILAGVAAAFAPVKINLFNSKTPLEEGKLGIVQINKLEAEELNEQSTKKIYMSQAEKDSAFAWQYGKVQEMNDFILKNFTWPVRLDLGDGWYATITNGMDFGYKDRGIVGGFSIEPEDLEKDLRDKKVRIIKYTDEYGNNLLIVKSSDEDMAIYDSRISTNDPRTGFGVIMARRGYRIERIGIIPVEFADGVKGILIIADIRGDGLVGVILVKKPNDPFFSDEYRIEIATSK